MPGIYDKINPNPGRVEFIHFILIITHHVARHTFATQALNRGIPVEVIQKLMGHTDIHTTQIYAKMLTSTIVKEMEKMGRLGKD